MGLRREVLILLPVALLLLVVLSTFTLFSFRNALVLLVEERRGEAARLAGEIARRLSDEGLPSPAALRALAPHARGIAVADREGEALVSAGEIPSSALLAPFAGEDVLAAGPDTALPDRVAGRAPLGAGRWVRVDLPAEVLPAQQRGVGVLSVVVLGLNAALLVLVLSFLRHLMAPWKTLIERARQMGAEQEPGEGEIEFLLATFEKAIAASAQTRRPEDDIEALERTLSTSLQSGLLLLDRAGSVLALNAVAAGLLGIEPPPPGTSLAVALAAQPELRSLLESAVADQSAPRRQEIAVQAEGGTRTLGLTVHPLRRDDGSIRGWLVLFADLTEVQRRAEEVRLAESLARLGEMAGGVAHELRNSLATLRGYLTLIERRPDEESIADYMAEIRHEADHLERVLEDFLAFARPGSARFQELSLVRLARRAAADPSLGGMEVRVHAADPPEDIRLRGDAQLLERALRNLLHNAAQAEREAGGSGPVELGIEAGADGVELAVEDRGPGLPPEVRERLFHPFATGRRGGVGLGLALAHRIITLHGGRIRLEDRPGGGTRALLTFPRDTIVTIGSESGSS
jgi:signal transduction histidine kinase